LSGVRANHNPFADFCLGLGLAQGTTRTPGRAFAQKAVSAEIDWEGISASVQSDEGKRELASLRNTLVELERTVASTGQEGSVPDWAKWKQILDAKIVENFEKAYACTKWEKESLCWPSL